MAHRSPGRSTDGFSLSSSSSDFRHTVVWAATLSLALAASSGVWAQQPASVVAVPKAAARDFDIPAGPLSPALSRFAGQSGVTLSSDAALTAGRSTQGLRGRHSVAGGFAQLLRDTGLDAMQVGADTFVLRPATALAPATNTAPSDVYTLREVRVTGARVRDGETEGTGSYTTEAITIGKTAQALREHPQSVSVITRQRLEDQNITSLAQAAEQAPGITVQDTNGYISALYSRGFAINSYQLDGGAPLDTGFAASLSMDLTQYDRVEVLRGAAGLLNGTGNPGGALNLVRKMPTATPQFNVSLSAGRWDNYRTEVDASGPLAFDGKLRGRAVLAYEDRKYFIDNRASRRPFFYGVLEADVGPDAVLAIGARDQGTHESGSFTGLPRYSTGADLGLPRSTGTVAPWSGVTGSSQEVFAKLTWRLAPRWTLRTNATRAWQEGHNTDAFTLGAIDPQTLTGSRWQNGYTESTDTQTLLDANLSGAFDAFGRTHEVLMGLDAQDVRSKWAARYRLDGNGSPADIFDMGANFFPASGYGPVERIYDPWAQRQYGAYGTLRLALSDATRLIVGARVNKYKYRQIYRELDTDTGEWSLTGNTRYSEPAKVTPFAGVVFDIDAQWSAYASYAQIFRPQADYKAGPAPGTGLKPMRGSNAEVGVKGNLLDGKVNTALALYRIVQDGRAIEDPRYDGETAIFSSNCCYLASGKVISQGIDTEVSGEVARGINLHAGYTYNSNRDKTENAAFSTITPRHSLKFWGTWHLPDAAGRWLIGGGATVQSTQYVSGTAATYDADSGKFNGPAVPFRYTQGGHAVWNAMAQYRIDPHWTVTFNLNNVFDKRYYRTVAGANLGNFYGEPRNAMVTLRGKF